MIYELKITTTGYRYEEGERKHREWLQMIGFKFEGDIGEGGRHPWMKVDGYVTAHSTLDDAILKLTDTGCDIIISKEDEESRYDYKIEIYDDWRE